MLKVIKHQSLITYFIALVWLINGLYCKVLNFVPRHQQIVGELFGDDLARPITLTIGILEIGMTIWVLSRIFKRFNTIFQIVIVALMNVIEFFAVPHLLLWGRLNAFFAFLFILVVYFNEFGFSKSKDS